MTQRLPYYGEDPIIDPSDYLEVEDFLVLLDDGTVLDTGEDYPDEVIHTGEDLLVAPPEWDEEDWENLMQYVPEEEED